MWCVALFWIVLWIAVFLLGDGFVLDCVMDLCVDCWVCLVYCGFKGLVREAG